MEKGNNNPRGFATLWFMIGFLTGAFIFSEPDDNRNHDRLTELEKSVERIDALVRRLRALEEELPNNED